MKKADFLFFMILILIIFTILLIKPLILNNAIKNNSKSNTLHIQELPFSFSVSDYVGINTDNDSLKFGTVMPGGEIKRKITVINPFEISVETSLNLESQVSGWISISEKDFILNPSKNKTLSVTLSIPGDGAYGNYTGILRLVMKER